MAHPIHMPVRGERSAPTFDKTKPRELLRFFDELEYLFERAQLTDSSDRKKQLLRYVDVDTEQIWRTFPEFKLEDKTYTDLKEAILKYYPDASGDYVYSLRDMDLMIGERQRLGIASANDLTAYHLQFIAITSWLIDKKQLGDLEQQRAYVRAFQSPLLSAINNRLQLKKPDHHPNIPYEVQDVYEAARFILQGSTIANQVYQAAVAPAPSTALTQPNSVTSSDSSIKKEEITSLLSEITKTLVGLVNQAQNQGQGQNRQSNNNRSLMCLMCSGPHLISACLTVLEYIKAGKCRRNQDGKVILSTGAWIPRDIPGSNMQEKIDEWHRQNPGQLAAATLFNAVDIVHLPESPLQRHASYQLSAADRIATLEAELFNLKARKPPNNPVFIRTRAQTKARIETVEDEDDPAAAAAQRAEDNRVKVEIIKAARDAQYRAEGREFVEDVIEEPVPTITTVPPSPVQQPSSTSLSEHPYRNARDAAYIPPARPTPDKPTNTAVKPQIFRRRQEPAYKTLPPIHDATIATEVYKRTMEAPITITQRELLSLSPEVRSQVRDATTTKRVQNSAPTTQNMMEVDEFDQEEKIPIVPTFAIPHAVHRTPPSGSLIVPDPYETYFRSLGPGQKPDPERLTVASDSVAIRSVHALIDNSIKIECILDPGCQIIAMSERACHEIGLAYDPAIRLNMQSANGEINQSLGLARNVPFRIGTITFYLQVHVIQTPAYDVLLGRPFDILTESVVRNFSNEDQTITICDPNTGQQITVLTFSKSARNHQCHKKDF